MIHRPNHREVNNVNTFDLLVQFTKGSHDLAVYELTASCKTLPELRAYVASTCVEHGFADAVGLRPYVSTMALPAHCREDIEGRYKAEQPVRAGLWHLFEFIRAAREREWELTCEALEHRTKAAEYSRGAASYVTRSALFPAYRGSAATWALHAASHARDAIRIEEGDGALGEA